MSRLASVLTQLVALAACSTSGAAMARVVQYEEVAFSTVTSLQTCGRWEVDGQFGEFRVVQAYFYGGMMLFVDMVRANDRGTWHEVFRGFTFHELNDDHSELELSDVRCSSSHTNMITVSGLAEPFESEPFSFTLTIDGATGRYEIERQSK